VDTEPLTLAPKAPKRARKELTDLALIHVGAQEAFERLLASPKGQALPWHEMFSIGMITLAHGRMFQGASIEQAQGHSIAAGLLRDKASINVLIGDQPAPAYESVTPMLNRLQQVYGAPADFRTRLLSVMAYHHRLAFVHPFQDGNGRTCRMMTHLQLFKLGLASPLWSLSRGLARSSKSYYRKLAVADQPRRGDLDGRGQLTQQGLFEFVEFMLDVCHDQIDYTKQAMDIRKLREKIEHVMRHDYRVLSAGVKTETARALHILLTHGTVTRADFKAFTGLGDRVSQDQLKKLTDLRLVESPTPKARDLHPGLPVWYAQWLFPDLHSRLG
jgi:Fic family protein